MSVLLEVENLCKRFAVDGGRAHINAVDGVSLTLDAGEVLGIVGESGCGKSTLARLILRLIEPSSGTVRFDGEDLLALDARALRARRKDMQIVFQDPFASLDPRQRVSAILEEPLLIHGVGSRAEREEQVRQLLERVGLTADAAQRYPHEFSGGQRQRISIARAIALQPRLVVADEPVSALDVSVQSQVLNLLVDLKTDLGLSYLFISHDLSVIRHICDRVAVMYLGRIVEFSDTESLFSRPAHPYTQALLSAIPEPDPKRRRKRIVLQGDVPSPEHPPAGCAFHPRCPRAVALCAERAPVLRTVPGEPTAHTASCHLVAPG